MDWLNDPEVNKYLESGGDYSLEKLNDYLTGVESRDDLLFWAIHLKSNDKHIGNIKIDPVNLKHGLAEYGILMGDRTEWRHGYAQEASNTVIEYMFTVLNCRKITLGFVADHVAALNLYLKLGFVHEGLYRKHFDYGHEYCDVIRMALFNSRYQV
ncbi:MAG: GNAT family N-acetyltransferase [Colwellia sp.]|nr:GNAT family N-acetyltransferase [Colwellia sp.]